MNPLDDIQARHVLGEELTADEDRRLAVALGVQPRLKDEITRDEQIHGLLNAFGRCDADSDDFVNRALEAYSNEGEAGSVQPPALPTQHAQPAINIGAVSPSRRIAKKARAPLVVLSIAMAVLLVGAALVISGFVGSGSKRPIPVAGDPSPKTGVPKPDVVPKKPVPPPKDVPKPSPTVATITALENCRWKDQRVPPQRLPAGSLHLLSGNATLKFGDGSSVTLTGPADFDVVSNSLGELHRGRLSASVPKAARGFTIRTPIAVIVDLGTEFRVAVEGDGTTQVNVVSGKVEYRDRLADGTTGDRTRLFAGESHRVKPVKPRSGGSDGTSGQQSNAGAKTSGRVYIGTTIINGKSYSFSTREEYEQLMRKLGRKTQP